MLHHSNKGDLFSFVLLIMVIAIPFTKCKKAIAILPQHKKTKIKLSQSFLHIYIARVVDTYELLRKVLASRLPFGSLCMRNLLIAYKADHVLQDTAGRTLKRKDKI
jgi:hypothetical protein